MTDLYKALLKAQAEMPAVKETYTAHIKGKEHTRTLPPQMKQRVHPIVDPETGCHNWPGYLNDKGYGKLGRGGKSYYAHRWYWEQENGPIPEGMFLDHLCRNPRCCNPDHLEVVTNRENCIRGMKPTMISHRENRCLRGHPLTEENTYQKTDGTRQCRICLRVVNNRSYARRKAAKQSCPTL